MAKKILTTPIQQSDLAGIKPGDVILFDWAYYNLS